MRSRPRASSLPRSLDSARRRSSGVNAEDDATSKITSTRVSRLLTFWPPGPPDRENRIVRSAAGITTPRPTRRSSIALEPRLALLEHRAHRFAGLSGLERGDEAID